MGSVLWLSFLATTAVAAADDFTAYLNAARSQYDATEYEAALDALAKARPHAKGPADDSTLGLYEGAIRLELGQVERADAALRAALLLKPDATFPFKVSPKIAATLERVRGQVQLQLAPLLAQKEKERQLAEEQRLAAAKAEEARRAQELAAAEASAAEAKRQAEARAAELERMASEKQTLEAQRREAAAKAAEAQARAEALEAEARKLAAEKQRLEELRRTAEKEETERREAARLDAERRAAPAKAALEPQPRPVDVAPSVPAVRASLPRPPPIGGITLTALTAVAVGVASAFGLLATGSLDKARAAVFHGEAASALSSATQQALVANVSFGVSGALGLGALFAFLAWAGERPVPPPATAEGGP